MSESSNTKSISPFGRFARGVYDGLRRLPELPSAYLHPDRRESIAKLSALKDSHAGERCFVVGNGPSLKKTDLTKLKGEFCIGMNRIFLAADELGFSPSVLVCVNDLVIEQSLPEFNSLQMPKFFSWRSHELLGMDAWTHYLYTSYTSPRFARDLRFRVWEGATVTTVCLQLAFHMGFSQVLLIGVDHSFVTQGTANTTVQSQGDDPNHFSASYFGKGFRWQLPDLETSEIGYRMARTAFERDGREVLDATVDGKLQVFKKVAYADLF